MFNILYLILIHVFLLLFYKNEKDFKFTFAHIRIKYQNGIL